MNKYKINFKENSFITDFSKRVVYVYNIAFFDNKTGNILQNIILNSLYNEDYYISNFDFYTKEPILFKNKNINSNFLINNKNVILAKFDNNTYKTLFLNTDIYNFNLINEKFEQINKFIIESKKCYSIRYTIDDLTYDNSFLIKNNNYTERYYELSNFISKFDFSISVEKLDDLLYKINNESDCYEAFMKLIRDGKLKKVLTDN
jgi:hypothetical protein